MKKKIVLIVFSAILLLPLSADVFDISLSFGLDSYLWPQNGISFSYGASVGLSERCELSVYGISQAVPKPFSNNMLAMDIGVSLLGRRTSGTKIAGSGINMLLSAGAFYITENNGAGILISFTPLTVGNPITGRRERMLRTAAGWDFVNNKLVVSFSLLSLDYYIRGSYRDYDI